MDIKPILDYAATAIYWALGLVAIYGVFCVVLLVRRISQKRFSNSNAADQFQTEVQDQLRSQNYDAITKL